MDESNPLEINTSVSLTKRSQQSNINKRGRPSLAKVVKFSPQPKSIISQLLIKVKEAEKCDIVKDKINLSEDKNAAHRKTNVENDNCNQIQFDLEPEINSYEDFTFNLTSELGGHDNLKECYLLHKKDQNIYQSIHHVKKAECAVKLLEIPCYVCPHRSSSQKEHREHVSVHRNQPYKCNFPNCNYICKLSSNLIKHKRIHTSEKPYLCDQCTFRTNFGNSLKVHKRTHTSERPYGCQYCSYQCNSSSNLKKHCLHRHREVS